MPMQAPGGAAPQDYTAVDIQVLEGTDAVRRRPGMYIGSTDERGLHHLVYEIVDNAVDEAMAGYCDRITIKIAKDSTVTVHDNGRGIPIDVHPTTGLTGMETAMTTLHAGAKFGGAGYKVSGGLHGVGAHVVNALSGKMRVEVQRDGRRVFQEYSRGRPTGLVTDMLPMGGRGTTVSFKSDSQIFGEHEYDFPTLATRLREMAYLNAGLEIQIIDERSDRETSFYFDGGIASFVRHLNASRRTVFDKPLHISRVVEDATIEVALQYNDGFAETVMCFANCINTRDGGTHLTGFRSALTRVINDYARKQKLIKDDMPNLQGEDVREGLTAVISVRITDPQFEGQTKGKLGNPEVKGYVETVMNESLSAWLEEHPADGRRIIDKCLTAARAREAARKARDLVQRKTAMEGGTLPGKLADCTERNPANCEIYIVEGESAGGSAKMGRDRRFQAILPLKGKILNVEKARLDRMLNHEEIRALITALGVGIGETFDIEKLRYHRVIIMTDADVDGSHIRTLLLTFFFRHMDQLIGNDNLYIAQPPLYRVAAGREAHWVFSEREKDLRILELALRDVTASSGGDDDAEGAPLRPRAEHIQALRTLLSDLEGRGYSRDLIFALLRSIDFDFLEGIDFTDRDSVDELGRRLEELDPVSAAYVRGDEYTSFELHVRNGDPNVAAAFDSSFVGGTLRRLYDEYATLAEYDGGATYSVKRRDRDLGAFDSTPALIDMVGEILEGGVRGLTLQRYKGLGEMNPEQLWESTMNPETRTLLKVDIDNLTDCEDVFTTLMGEEVAPRKAFIQSHAKSVKNLDV